MSSDHSQARVGFGYYKREPAGPRAPSMRPIPLTAVQDADVKLYEEYLLNGRRKAKQIVSDRENHGKHEYLVEWNDGERTWVDETVAVEDHSSVVKAYLGKTT